MVGSLNFTFMMELMALVVVDSRSSDGFPCCADVCMRAVALSPFSAVAIVTRAALCAGLIATSCTTPAVISSC